ncbi:MAG: 50S ribosomal protein L23 [Bacteroidota bacterium]
MSVLKKPLITEKMTKTSEKLGQYGFIVDRNANKVQIKKAVEKMYNVSVDSVNTLTIAGKRKTRYTKTGFVSGSTGTFKKAIVTLKKGDTIDFYSNI